MKNLIDKIKHNTLLGIIIGIIITSGISVFALDYLYDSKQVSYVKGDSTEINVYDALGELYNLSSAGFEPELVWTNPNPSVNFAAQTLTIDLSKYRYFLVVAGETSIYMRTNISDTSDKIQYRTYLGTKYGEMSSGSSHYVVRGVERIATGIKFYECYLHNANDGNVESWNQGLKPQYIYGIK